MINAENYYFTKKLYWGLIIDCKKKGDNKNAEFLQDSWKEIEKFYKDFDFKALKTQI